MDSGNLDGTFLIRHTNTKVQIGERVYASEQVSSKKPLPALLPQKLFLLSCDCRKLGKNRQSKQF